MANMLLPSQALIKTGPVDHADWNYRPILGWIMRRRYALFRSLLPPGKKGRWLEFGYGSGIFMPELSARCDELHGVDIHPFAEEVRRRLTDVGVAAQLAQVDSEQLPYQSSVFDLVVSISSLEFANDPVAAAGEIRRVLKPDGCLIVITPGRSKLVDLGLMLLTGQSAKKDYGDRRERLMGTLLNEFTIDSKLTFPPLLSSLVCLYSGFRLLPKSTGEK